MMRSVFSFIRRNMLPQPAFGGPSGSMAPQMIWIRVLVLFLLPCLLGLAGCPQPTTDFSDPPVTMKDGRPAGAFVFIVDGVNGKIFNELLAAGKLPNFQKYFVEQGAYTPGAIANVPSVTLANLTSIVTGKYPAHHGVLANNWFDRNKLIWRNYMTLEEKNILDTDCTGPQIYDYFPEDFTVSIFLQPHKGASKFFENALSAGPAWGLGFYELTDDITMYRFPEMMWLSRGEKTFPKIVCTYLLAPDYMAYTQGLGEAYRKSIIRVDKQIGKLMDDLKAAGVLDKLVVAVVSDHSHDDVSRHFHMKPFLEKQGYNVVNQPFFTLAALEDRKKHYDPYDAVLIPCGEQYAAISLRKRDATGALSEWAVPSTVDQRVKLVNTLLMQEAVDVVAWRGEDGAIECHNHRAIMRITRTADGKIRCQVLKGDNPFGFEQENLSLTPRQWLEKTHTSQYPNLPVHLMNYFDSEKAGDIVLFAAPGWDFNGSNKAGHGGVRGDEDLRVPMLLRGPGVPQGKTIPVAQTVDLLPTLLRLMGRQVPNDLDGRPLFVSP